MQNKLLIISLLSLTACMAPAKMEQLKNGAMRLTLKNDTIGANPNNEIPMMTGEALKFCPHGFEKIKQRTDIEEGVSIYTWEIKC